MATDVDDLPIFDTPLHTPIELEDTPMSTDELVIYDPLVPRAWVQSSFSIDTYDVR